ncbi:MAG: MotA/TolQ/ExbB proton channel family protein [Lentisphaeria bacterium]
MYIAENILKASPVLIPVIFFCSIAALFIIIERFLHLHRAHIDVPEFLRGLINVLKRNNVVEAVAICDETPGPVAHVIRSIIIHGDEDESGMRRAAEDASLSEVPRLERRMKILITIAHITPLLGLLGTVLGMMGLFQEMEVAGHFVATTDLATHIWQALLTTAAGLTVAITVYAFYSLLLGKIETILNDMDKAASEVINFLVNAEVPLDKSALPEIVEEEKAV